jgi:CO/xanthine dehydrogenase Mo-binding subunit
MKAIGARLPRYDGLGHVKGQTQYVDDVRVHGTLWVKALRSPHHSALVKAIDTSKAESMPGVHAIVTAKDVPKNVYGHLEALGVPADEPLIADEDVRWKGQIVGAVAATTPQAAQDAVDAISVTYEEREPVLDIRTAADPGTDSFHQWGAIYPHFGPHNHRRVRKGDVDAAFDKADVIVEGVYRPQAIEHVPMETQTALVVPEPSGRLTIYSCTQAMYFSMGVVAAHLGWPLNKLKFVGGTVGGGFGGKVDVTVEPITCIAAMKTGKPVKYVYDRYEEMQVSSPRAAERIYIKDGVMNDGTIVARQVTLYADAGAYSRHSPYATTKAAAHMPGPYNIPNVHIDSWCVYTNRTPSSAMRGFGVTIADFALEVQMDKLARLIGMDPLEFRFINAYRDGDMKAHRQPTEGAALIECMQEASRAANWPVAEKYMAMSSYAKGA